MHYRVLSFVFFALISVGALSAQESDTIAYFDPNQVFVVEDDSVELAKIAAWQQVAGQWEYDKPYVHADGSSFVGKLGKPIAKSKLKKGLDKAFKKLKIKKRWNSMVLTADGEWELRMLGMPLKGKYVYDPAQEQLTLKWNGIPLTSHVHRDGNKLYIAFDTDRLLMFMHLISGLSHSETTLTLHSHSPLSLSTLHSHSPLSLSPISGVLRPASCFILVDFERIPPLPSSLRFALSKVFCIALMPF